MERIKTQKHSSYIYGQPIGKLHDMIMIVYLVNINLVLVFSVCIFICSAYNHLYGE